MITLRHLLLLPEFLTPVHGNIIDSFSKKTTVHSSFVIYCFNVNFQLLYTKKTMQILFKETTVHSSSSISKRDRSTLHETASKIIQILFLSRHNITLTKAILLLILPLPLPLPLMPFTTTLRARPTRRRRRRKSVGSPDTGAHTTPLCPGTPILS